MADSEVSSDGTSSDTTSPAPPTPECAKRSSSKKSSGGKQHKKHSHRGRQGRRKGKRKYVPSSSSASSSSRDSADSDSSDSDHVSSKKRKCSKKASRHPGGKGGRKSALFDVFEKHYPDLETLTSSCVHAISSKLFSRKLISEHVWDQVITGQDSDTRKASKVLHNVRQTLKVSPGKLRTLVQVLEGEPTFDDLTTAIESEFCMH